MLKKNNYILIFVCCFLIFFLCQQSLALDVGLQQAGQTGLGAKDVRITIAEIIKVAMGILSIIVIGIILISGVYYMLSKNDPEKKLKVRKILISCMIGLVIILSAYATASFILNQLLEATGPGQPAVNQINNNNNNQQQNNYLAGDGTGDGILDSADLSMISAYISGNPVTCYDSDQQPIDCGLVLDFDNNGQVNANDINGLNNYLVGLPNSDYLPGDANGDGAITVADLNILNNYIISGAATCHDSNQNIISCVIALDINGDGYVDPIDTSEYERLLNQSNNYIQGDADGDGAITILDVNILENIASGQPGTCHDLNQNVIDCFLALDINGDGQIAYDDLTMLEKNYIKGDANGNGVITSQDSTIARNYIMGNQTTCHDLNQNVIDCRIVLDLNGDKIVNGSDVTIINTFILNRNYILGDANGDGAVTASDMNILNNYINFGTAICRDLKQEIIDCKIVLDMDSDGYVGATDLSGLENLINNNYIVGDGDGDGVITIADLNIINNYLNPGTTICRDLDKNIINCLIVLDINGDGYVMHDDVGLLENLIIK